MQLRYREQYVEGYSFLMGAIKLIRIVLAYAKNIARRSIVEATVQNKF